MSVLKRPVQLNQKWVIKLCEHFSLAHDLSDRVLIPQLIFLQDLNRVETTCVFFSGEDDLAEATAANNPQLLEIIDLHLSLFC